MVLGGPEVWRQCYSLSMNSGKIVAGGRDGWTGEIDGSTRGPRGPKNYCTTWLIKFVRPQINFVHFRSPQKLRPFLPWIFTPLLKSCSTNSIPFTKKVSGHEPKPGPVISSRVPKLTCIWMSTPGASGLGTWLVTSSTTDYRFYDVANNHAPK